MSSIAHKILKVSGATALAALCHACTSSMSAETVKGDAPKQGLVNDFDNPSTVVNGNWTITVPAHAFADQGVKVDIQPQPPLGGTSGFSGLPAADAFVDVSLILASADAKGVMEEPGLPLIAVAKLPADTVKEQLVLLIHALKGDQITGKSAIRGDQLHFSLTTDALGLTVYVPCGNCRIQLVRTPDGKEPPGYAKVEPTPQIPDLAAFTAAAATTGADGGVQLTFGYPPATDAFAKIDVRRALGPTPPADCTTGTEVTTLSAPYPPGYLDETGIADARQVSYVACIFDAGGKAVHQYTQANVMPRSVTPPPSLLVFSAATGDNQGEILLKLDYPEAADDIHKIEIHRLKGAKAPASDCSNGDIAFTLQDLLPSTLIDQTGAQYGESFSYRVCIYDRAGNMQTVNTALNTPAKDSQPPQGMTAFQAKTGTISGTIALAFAYPITLDDYAYLDVRRLAGEAPPQTCTGGESIARITNFTVTTFTDAVSPSLPYGYLLCVVDHQGNVTRSLSAEADAAP